MAKKLSKLEVCTQAPNDLYFKKIFSILDANTHIEEAIALAYTH